MNNSHALYTHPSALLYGDIRIAHNVSIWPYVVMRAESEFIQIGEGSNIQDFVMIHVGYATPTIIGANCSITHHATIHGCTIGDNCLIGINATVMDGAVIGENSIVGPHSLVREGEVIPPNSIVVGAPAKVIKTRSNEIANRMNAWMYQQNAQAYLRGDYRYWSSAEFKEATKMKQLELNRL